MNRTFAVLILALVLAVPHNAEAKHTSRNRVATVSKQKVASGIGLADEKAQQLVNSARLHAFYDPANLSRAPIVSAKGAVLMDNTSGAILWSKNADLKLYPASTTKIMTALLFAENTQPTDIVTCTNVKIRDIEPSSLHIQTWEKFTSQDLLYGTLLRSANDGSVVIAEHVSGSVAKFADLMNSRAREAGATNTHFHNPNGLPDPEHYTTAHDLACITRAALANDRFRDAVSTRKRVISRSKSKDVTVASKAKKFYETFPGADGVKTGYTRAARHCFVGSATRNGRQLIAVLLGATDDATGETATVLGWAFRRFPTIIAMKAGMLAPAVSVSGGVKPTLLTSAGSDLITYTDAVGPAPVIQTIAVPRPGLAAPIRRGDVIGTLVARVDGEDRAHVPLIANEDIAIPPVVSAVKTAGSIMATVGKFVMWTVGAGAVFLIGLACYGTATTKSARRRRNRVSPQGRGVDNGGPRQSEWRDSDSSRNQRGPGAGRDHR